MKAKRHAKILEIIHNESVRTQEELQHRLAEHGFTATQATVSRDIREMRLIKVMEGTGMYRYSVAGREDGEVSSKFGSLFSEIAINVDYAGNIVVVKCLAGMANATCASIDALQRVDIVGTISGDDTFLCVMKSENMAIDLASELKKLLKR